MLTRIMGVGLLAGVVSGLLVACIQHVTTVPLILKAEVYEQASQNEGKPHGTSWTFGDEARVILVHGDMTEHADGAVAWAPADGLERTAYTTLATVGTAVGFSLVLLAIMLASSAQIGPRTAILWGLGAFIATGLAPGLGLSPELPGSAAAELLPRQIWWLSTALLTAIGIWLVFQRAAMPAIAIGLVLILLPHLIGAPQVHEFKSTAPAELAGHFASASLAVHALLWTAVGASTGYFWRRAAQSQVPA
jgi:cobalt transporter subunit CbtA